MATMCSLWKHKMEINVEVNDDKVLAMELTVEEDDEMRSKEVY